LAVVAARQIVYPTRLGGASEIPHSVGRGCRLSAASCTITIFGYEHPRATRTAFEAHQERRGVCRDHAHLAVAFCGCLNIPARYCTGYITDIGLPPPYAPVDFSAWIEVYLGHRWYAFDPRNNAPRIGRILIAQGRDVPLTNAFGPQTCQGFVSKQMKCRQDDTPPSRAFFAQARVRGSATRSRIAGLLRADRHIRRSLRQRRLYTQQKATMTVDLSPFRMAYQHK